MLTGNIRPVTPRRVLKTPEKTALATGHMDPIYVQSPFGVTVITPIRNSIYPAYTNRSAYAHTPSSPSHGRGCTPLYTQASPFHSGGLTAQNSPAIPKEVRIATN